MAAVELDTRWPVWPDGEEGKLLLDVVLDLPVDECFLLLYGGLTELRKAFNEAASNKEYSTTAWVESAEAVQAAAVGPTPPPLRDSAALKPGMLRRASYSGTMMGSKYRNEELFRLLEANPGTSYRVLTTILTTAMHGEKFRPVVMSSLTALPDGRTQYSIRTVVLFIVKPNGFIKAMIDKGARDGQRKNFEALRKVLEQYTTVREAADALEAAGSAGTGAAAPEAAAAPADGAPPVETAAAVAPLAPAGLLEAVIGSAACRHLDPWAAFLHARLAAAVPAVGHLLERQVLLAALGALFLLSALRLVVDMLLFIKHASAHPKDTIGIITHYLLKLVDVPESMQEVLLSCLIFYTVRLLINRLAGMLPAPPASQQVASPGSAAMNAASGSGGGDEVAGASGGSPASVTSGMKSEEAESAGIKYEGYAEAIAAAQARALSPTVSRAATEEGPSIGALQAGVVAAEKAASAMAASRQQGASFMKGFTKSLSGAFTSSRTRRGGPGDDQAAAAAVAGAALAAGAIAAASGTASAPSSPPTAVGPLAEGLLASSNAATPLGAFSEDEEDGSQPVAADGSISSSIPGSPPPPARLTSARPGATPAALSPLAVPRSLSESTSALALGESLGAGLSDLGSFSPPGGTLASYLPPGATMSPPRDVSPSPEQRASGGVMASGSSMTSFAKKLRDVLSPNAQPASPRERKSGDAEVGVLSPDQMLSPTAAQREFRPSMPAHLAPGLAASAVIEELFENQRLQPFRGWGHTWPGHFLPTDKVNHWSRREHDNFPLLTSPDFQAIAPPLPEGWQWCEEKWHIDLSGQIIDACDSQGWSYGLDFGYVKHPFQPNSGKKKISDFVRRRRWIRTRVPLELAAQPRTTTISQDNSSWVAAVEGGVPVGAVAAAVQEGTLGESDASTSAVPPLAAEAAPDQAANEGDGAAGGAGGSGIDNTLDVRTVVESMFAQVIARDKVETNIQEALSQQIGSRSSSTGSIRTAGQGPGQQEQMAGRAADLQPLPGMQVQEATPGEGQQVAAARVDEQEGEQVSAGAAATAGSGSSEGEGEAWQPSAAAAPLQVDSSDSVETAVSLSLPGSSSAVPVEPSAAAGSDTLAGGLSFDGVGGSDQLASPSQQLRGFERNSAHSAPPSGPPLEEVKGGVQEAAVGEGGEEAQPEAEVLELKPELAEPELAEAVDVGGSQLPAVQEQEAEQQKAPMQGSEDSLPAQPDQQAGRADEAPLAKVHAAALPAQLDEAASATGRDDTLDFAGDEEEAAIGSGGTGEQGVALGGMAHEEDAPLALNNPGVAASPLVAQVEEDPPEHQASGSAAVEQQPGAVAGLGGGNEETVKTTAATAADALHLVAHR